MKARARALRWEEELEMIPEEEQKGGEENLEVEPQEAPKAESEDEQEGVPMHEYIPYYVPEIKPVEEK